MRDLENNKSLRTYATVSNCEKALVKLGLDVANPIIVGIPNTTRVTAIFQLQLSLDTIGSHAIPAVCGQGFMVV
tara:strand:+ start:640 stop:861 length:222 start_codon:yes stop_codon:yes gene_type:complete